jgi:putative transposase
LLYFTTNDKNNLNKFLYPFRKSPSLADNLLEIAKRILMSYPRLHVSTQLSVDELGSVAKATPERRMQLRILAIRYLLQGHTTVQAAQAFACSESQVRQWVRRYNAEGLEGLRERSRSGRPPLLAAGQVEAFKERVRRGRGETESVETERASDIRHLLAEEFDAHYSPSGTDWLLRRLGVAHAGPRPRHAKSIPTAERTRKKRS